MKELTIHNRLCPECHEVVEIEEVDTEEATDEG
jgi:hypothetical protein